MLGELIEKLHGFIKKHGFYKINKILYELEKFPKSYIISNKLKISTCVYLVLKEQDEDLTEILTSLLEKIDVTTVRRALNILHIINTTRDGRLISNSLSLIFNKDIKEFLFKKIEEKMGKEFAQKMRYIHSVYEIEIDRNDFLIDREKIFKKYGGILIEAYVETGGRAKAKLMKVASVDFHVDVHNCTYRLKVRKNNLWVDFQEIYEKYDDEIYHKLCKNVIYQDNDGAINISGIYYPKSPESVQLFKQLLGTAKER